MSYEAAIAEAEARVGVARADGPLVAAHAEIQRVLQSSHPATEGFDAALLADGYLGLGVPLQGADLLVEVDVAALELAPGAHTVTLDLGGLTDFQGISLSNREFGVPERAVPDVLAGRVPVRTQCSRDHGRLPGRLLSAAAWVAVDGQWSELTVHLSALQRGSLELAEPIGQASDIDLIAIDIGVWSTDCKRANDCSTPDCSANILGVTVTGYCSWFETLFGISCRCVIT